MKQKIIILFVVVFVLNIINFISLGQPSNLSDRELLIQLYSKIDVIEKAVNKIVDNSELVQRNIVNLDKRITKNESNIDLFCENMNQIMAKWNILLTFFLTLLVAVIASIIGRFINGRKAKV